MIKKIFCLLLVATFALSTKQDSAVKVFYLTKLQIEDYVGDKGAMVVFYYYTDTTDTGVTYFTTTTLAGQLGINGNTSSIPDSKYNTKTAFFTY